MSYIDLQPTLQNWTYDPEEISVRKILGMDGTVRVQMRVELGIVQMEATGRPDGDRPFGCDSLLAYHRKRLEEYVRQRGDAEGFTLSADDCESLRTEASLFYRRYVAMYVLEEYDAVRGDTSHALDIFDLCAEHAEEQDDRTCLESFRPYVLMMSARSNAYHALNEGEPASALAHVNRGILHLRSFYEEHGIPEAIEESDEMNMLRTLGAEVTSRMPSDSVVVTRRALREAIENECYEEAARLRDVLAGADPQAKA